MNNKDFFNKCINEYNSSITDTPKEKVKNVLISVGISVFLCVSIILTLIIII